MPLGVSWQDPLIGQPAGDAYLIVCIGDHSGTDDVYGIDIPTFSHQLRCRIHGQRSQVRVSDEEYQSYIDIYLLILETGQNRLHHLLSGRYVGYLSHL